MFRQKQRLSVDFVQDVYDALDGLEDGFTQDCMHEKVKIIAYHTKALFYL